MHNAFYDSLMQEEAYLRLEGRVATFREVYVTLTSYFIELIKSRERNWIGDTDICSRV